MAWIARSYLHGSSRRWARSLGRAAACILVLAFLGSPSLAPGVQAQARFEGEGRVVGIDGPKATVTLDHGPIPGLMSAMQMEFPVKDGALLRGLRVGDVVRFGLEARGSEWVVATVVRLVPRQAGVPAPDFNLPTLSGGSVRLSDLRGKVVLLNFWATWCVPCRTEMPTIEDLFQRYREQGLEVLAVNLDMLSTAGVEAFVKEVAVTFRVILDPAWSIARAYNVTALPTTYLIDRSGNVVVREVGERNWNDGVSRTGIEGLLSESAPK